MNDNCDNLIYLENYKNRNKKILMKASNYFNFPISIIDSYKVYSPYDILIIFKNGNKIMCDICMNNYRYINYKNYEEEIRCEFKYRLKSFMYRRNETIYSLSKKINVDTEVINNYLIGYDIPDFVILKRISDTLKIDINNFYYDESNMTIINNK